MKLANMNWIISDEEPNHYYVSYHVWDNYLTAMKVFKELGIKFSQSIMPYDFDEIDGQTSHLDTLIENYEGGCMTKEEFKNSIQFYTT